MQLVLADAAARGEVGESVPGLLVTGLGYAPAMPANAYSIKPYLPELLSSARARQNDHCSGRLPRPA